MPDATPWIVLKYDVQPPVFRCGHCKDIHVIKLPMAIDGIVKASDAFIGRHKKCPPEIS